MCTAASCLKRLLLLSSAVVLCAMAPAGARADAPIVKLKAALMPEVLGASTTVGFGFRIGTHSGAVPPSLLRVRVHFPPGLIFLRSTLGGGESCSPAALLERGIVGCPANSRMGSGHALVEVGVGHIRMSEAATITVLTGEPNPNYVEGLFYAEGWTPVAAQLVFPMAMYFETGPAGILLDATVPLILSWPGGPFVSVVDFGAEIGPRHLIYFKEVDGKVIAYRPTGLILPKHCPLGGFRFSADFFFLGGSHIFKHQVVPCPRPQMRSRRGRHT